MTQLGRLEKIYDLRSTWESEDRDFSPWLAQEENLQILADTIGLDLELEAVEKNVGPFRADILCKDISSDSWVLIENQLEKTDHKHLGQLMTYAAGLQAVTIVWIADVFSEEHRAAMDWLNKITDDNFRFFGLEIELWRIDDSNPAPKFNIISKPNNWSKLVSDASNKIDRQADTPLKQRQLKYWSCLSEFLANEKVSLRIREPRAQQWYPFSAGRSGFHFHATIHTSENRVGMELYISNDSAKQYFTKLLEYKDDIQNKIGPGLEWRELPDKKGSRIVIFDDAHFDNEENWQQDMVWFKNMLEKFDRAFRPIIQKLELDNETELEAAE